MRERERERVFLSFFLPSSETTVVMDRIRRLVLVGVALGSDSELPLKVDGRRGEELLLPTDVRERFAGVGPLFS